MNDQNPPNPIKAARVWAGRTVLDVSFYLRVSQQAIRFWEDGEKIPLPRVQQLADYYGCSTDFLLGRTTDPTPPANPATAPQDAIPRIDQPPDPIRVHPCPFVAKKEEAA